MRLAVAPLRDERVHDQVTLRLPRLPFGEGPPECVLALTAAHAGDVAAAVGTKGGDDIVGPPVVESLGVGGDGPAHALDHFGVGRLWAHEGTLRWDLVIAASRVRAQKP